MFAQNSTIWFSRSWLERPYGCVENVKYFPQTSNFLDVFRRRASPVSIREFSTHVFSHVFCYLMIVLKKKIYELCKKKYTKIPRYGFPIDWSQSVSISVVASKGTSKEKRWYYKRYLLRYFCISSVSEYLVSKNSVSDGSARIVAMICSSRRCHESGWLKNEEFWNFCQWFEA